MIDENLSYRVANAIRALLTARTGLQVEYVRDLHPPGTSDPSWIRQFAARDGNAVVSGDTQILQHWPDLIAYRESGLIAFFPPPSFDKIKGYGQAAYILRWWPVIVEKIKVSDRGDTWRLPWAWTPDINSFQKLDDPRFRDRTTLISAAVEPLARPLQFRP